MSDDAGTAGLTSTLHHYLGMGRRLLPLPGTLRILAAEQLGYLTSAQCQENGMDFRARRRRVAAGIWSEVARGVLDTEPTQTRTIRERQRRQVELALLLAGEGGVAVGLAALLLHGCWALPAQWRARATRAAHTRGRSGAQHYAFEVVEAEGRRAADVGSAILEALGDLDRLHLVGVLDWALHEGHVDDIDDLVRRGAGRRSVSRLRECAGLADGRAESILETWARLQCADEGIPPTTLQLPVRDGSGRVLARGDLAWRLPDGRWLVLEIDGAAEHDEATTIRRDRHRHNWMVGGGRLVVVRADASDLRAGTVPAQIRGYLAELAAA